MNKQTALFNWRKFKSGCTMVEAKKPISFRVNKHHVKDAKPGSNCYCVMANAMRDQLGDTVDNVVFKNSTAYLKTGTRILRYVLSKTLVKAIKTFDNKKHWELSLNRDYTLSPPAPTKTRAAMRNRWKGGRPVWNKKIQRPGSRRAREITRQFDLSEV